MRRTGREEVRIGGHQVRFRELHRRFRATLRGRVRGLTGQHRDPVMRGERHRLRVADRDPRDMHRGDRLLVVGEDVGAPPTARNVRSNAANTLGRVLSRIGITTRNRLNASQATNSTVFTPPTTGPSPKSYCNHSPGSVTHGRCTRRFPARHDAFTAATARLVDRSDPLTSPGVVEDSAGLSAS